MAFNPPKDIRLDFVPIAARITEDFDINGRITTHTSCMIIVSVVQKDMVRQPFVLVTVEKRDYLVHQKALQLFNLFDCLGLKRSELILFSL